MMCHASNDILSDAQSKTFPTSASVSLFISSVLTWRVPHESRVCSVSQDSLPQRPPCDIFQVLLEVNSVNRRLDGLVVGRVVDACTARCRHHVVQAPNNLRARVANLTSDRVNSISSSQPSWYSSKQHGLFGVSLKTVMTRRFRHTRSRVLSSPSQNSPFVGRQSYAPRRPCSPGSGARP